MKLFTATVVAILIQISLWPAQLRADEVTVNQKGAVLTAAFTFGALAGGFGVFFGTAILALALITTGSEFVGVAKFAALAHLPVMIIEGIMTGFIASYLMKVKPEILGKKEL